MRTQSEIVDLYRKKAAFLDFTNEVLIAFLDYDHAKEFLKPEVTAEAWEVMSRSVGGDAPTHSRLLGESDISEQMAGYMRFAWGKVEDHRGISAGRSVQKLAALAWLTGDDEILPFSENNSNYAQYGAPILKHICEKYGLPMPSDRGLLRMAEGLPCVKDCEEGCGR